MKWAFVQASGVSQGTFASGAMSQKIQQMRQIHLRIWSPTCTYLLSQS